MNIPKLESRCESFVWTSDRNEDPDRRSDEKFQMAYKPQLALNKKPRRRAGIHRRRMKKVN